MNKPKKKPNAFDVLVDELTQRFLNIPNFHLVQEDPKRKKIFDSLIFRLSDFVSFKELVLNSFIPAIKESSIKAKKMVLESKYKSLISQSDMDAEDSME